MKRRKPLPTTNNRRYIKMFDAYEQEWEMDMRREFDKWIEQMEDAIADAKIWCKEQLNQPLTEEEITTIDYDFYEHFDDFATLTIAEEEIATLAKKLENLALDEEEYEYESGQGTVYYYDNKSRHIELRFNFNCGKTDGNILTYIKQFLKELRERAAA